MSSGNAYPHIIHILGMLFSFLRSSRGVPHSQSYLLTPERAASTLVLPPWVSLPFPGLHRTRILECALVHRWVLSARIIMHFNLIRAFVVCSLSHWRHVIISLHTQCTKEVSRFTSLKNDKPPAKDGCRQVAETRTKPDESKIWPLPIVASVGKMGRVLLGQVYSLKAGVCKGTLIAISKRCFQKRDHVTFESLSGSKYRSPVTDL